MKKLNDAFNSLFLDDNNPNAIYSLHRDRNEMNESGNKMMGFIPLDRHGYFVLKFIQSPL